MKTGIELISEERQRQVNVEGWTSEHDELHHCGELSRAASSYAWAGFESANGIIPNIIPSCTWPWTSKWWKPSSNPVRNLVKAGALIAAEIDRLSRLTEKSESKK